MFSLCVHFVGELDISPGSVINSPSFLFFPQYGDVLNLLISSRKTGSAVVEFATVKAAVSVQSPCWVCWGWHRTGDSPVIKAVEKGNESLKARREWHSWRHKPRDQAHKQVVHGTG